MAPSLGEALTTPAITVSAAMPAVDGRPSPDSTDESAPYPLEEAAPIAQEPATEDEPVEPEEPSQLAQAPKRRPKSDLPHSPQPRPEPPAPMARTIRRGAVEIPQDDGSFELRTGGTRSWRNNNPGNIAYGKIAIANGAVGRDEYGTAIFPTEETGRRAALATLQSPVYQAFTLDQAIAKWAPEHENDTARYQRFVQSQAGLPGDAQLNTLTQPQLELVYEAIKRFEGWRAGPEPSRVRRQHTK